MDSINIGQMMRRIILDIDGYLSKNLPSDEINIAQVEYLMFIYLKDGINQSELANMKHVGKASVTKAIRILEDANFVRRETDGFDKRNYRLYITQKGKGYVGEMVQRQKRMRDKAFAGFSPEEREQFGYLLTKLSGNIQKLGGSDEV